MQAASTGDRPPEHPGEGPSNEEPLRAIRLSSGQHPSANGAARPIVPPPVRWELIPNHEPLVWTSAGPVPGRRRKKKTKQALMGIHTTKKKTIMLWASVGVSWVLTAFLPCKPRPTFYPPALGYAAGLSIRRGRYRGRGSTVHPKSALHSSLI